MANSPAPTQRPVFVDSTGSRRRWFAILGVTSGVVLTLVSAMLIAGFLGGAGSHLPGLPPPRPEPAIGQPTNGRTPTGNPAPGTASRKPSGTSASGNPAGSAAVPGGAATPTLATQPGHRSTAHPTPTQSHRK
jgi:hypothetical protein